MKTITMYELLGLVKDGKAPKKIRFDNTNWNKRCGRKNTYYISDNDRDLFIYFFRKNLTFTLNDTVEILEEEKKIPEKLPTWFSVETKQSRELNIEYANTNFENMYEKINEIIDYLKIKGDE